jgi:hypothetical protein
MTGHKFKMGFFSRVGTLRVRQRAVAATDGRLQIKLVRQKPRLLGPGAGKPGTPHPNKGHVVHEAKKPPKEEGVRKDKDFTPLWKTNEDGAWTAELGWPKEEEGLQPNQRMVEGIEIEVEPAEM